jgi:tyrosinase
MVRIRKDAETLTPAEIGMFLGALARVHDVANGSIASKFAKYARSHGDAFYLGIHQSNLGNPLFLAWHRAFLLDLERVLQEADPRVALPYWRFDRPAPTLFTPDFIGAVPDNAASAPQYLVEFSATNPLRGWQMADGRGALVRSRNGDRVAPIARGELDDILASGGPTAYQPLSREIEFNYHNGAHSMIGGWLGSGTSPRDPLFFLLHVNVDRAWAHWQAQQRNRVDPDGVGAASYSAAGSYPGPSVSGRFRKGSYARDAMWPWTAGDQGTSDQMAVWPAYSYGMPGGQGGSGPRLPPVPASQIDYLDISGRGLAHWACYDDIDYHGNPIGNSP